MTASTPPPAPTLDAPQLAVVRWQRRKLEITYWVMLAATAALHLVAFLLIGAPLLQLVRGLAFTADLLYPAGLGLLLMVLLFLFAEVPGPLAVVLLASDFLSITDVIARAEDPTMVGGGLDDPPMPPRGVRSPPFRSRPDQSAPHACQANR